MLRPAYLAGCSDELVQLYSQLENDIITDMARRMKKMGAVTDASEWQANIYREIGGLQSDIQAKLKKYDSVTQKQLQDLFDEALQKSAQNDTAVLNKANLSDSQQQILEATVKKTASSGIVTGSKKVVDDAKNGYIKVFSGVQRATMTIASSAASDFVSTANQTYMQVVTGAFDYKTALKHGIDALAEKGVTTVEYTDSGKVLKRTIEGALRSNIMTGINQTAQQITQDNCADLGCDLVEVDAHLGARPSHAEWQGGVYSLNGEKTIDGVTYKDFQSTCHPGEPDGICGINCRHSYYPYFPGMPRHYEQGELDEMNDTKVTYNGKEMTQYEAEQMQRTLERKIRMYKRQANALEAADLDSTAVKQQLNQWQNKAVDFTEQTGLRRDYSRERIGIKAGERQPTGITVNKTGAKTIYNGSVGSITTAYSNTPAEEAQNVRAVKMVAKTGKAVTLIPASDIEKRPDTYINGEKWEIKSPNGSISSIDNALKGAKEQADNIILDIQSDIPESKLKKAIYDRIRRSPNIQTVAVNKGKKVIYYTRYEIMKWQK